MNPWIARSIAGLFASVVVSLLIMLLLVLPRNLPGVPDHPRFKIADGNGTVSRYYWIGTLKEEWTVADGRAEGPMIQHYPNGSIMREIYYADSRPEGKVNEYYEQSASSVRMSRRMRVRSARNPDTAVGAKGPLKAEWTYQRGVREGPYRLWWPSGEVKEEGEYAGGRKTRVQKYPGLPG
jgi:hypothetical protein